MVRKGVVEMMNMRITVVGAGLQGASIAQGLMKRANICPKQIQFIEQTGKMLGTWEKAHDNVGMSLFGNPQLSRLDSVRIGYDDGNQYPVTTKGFTKFISQLADFCKAYKEKFKAIIPAVVVGVNPNAVTLHDGEKITHDVVILATGPHSGGINYPEWFFTLKQQARDFNIPILHSLDILAPVQPEIKPEHSHFIVVGSGANALNMVSSLIEQHGKTVTLVVRKPLEENPLAEQSSFVSPFFTPDGYKGNCALSKFQAEDTPENAKSVAIQKNVPRGLTRFFLEQCQQWQEEGKLNIIVEPKYQLGIDTKQGKVCLNNEIYADGLIVSTGFKMDFQNSPLYKKIIEENQLATHTDGLAVVNEHLRWLHKDGTQSNIFVTGHLAAHQLGPNAVNAVGAALARDAIASDPVFQQQANQAGQQLNKVA
jgi:lysine/ornithine N-monooxygenase